MIVVANFRSSTFLFIVLHLAVAVVAADAAVVVEARAAHQGVAVVVDVVAVVFPVEPEVVVVAVVFPVEPEVVVVALVFAVEPEVVVVAVVFPVEPEVVVVAVVFPVEPEVVVVALVFAVEPQAAVVAVVFPVEPEVVFVALVFAVEPEVVFVALVSVADVAEPQASDDIVLAFVVLVPVSVVAVEVDSSGCPRFLAFPNVYYSASSASSVVVAGKESVHSSTCVRTNYGLCSILSNLGLH